MNKHTADTRRRTAETRRRNQIAALPLDAPASVAIVNRALRLLGHGERLVRGRGYYYFVDGDAFTWFDQNISVCHIASLTLRAVLDCREQLIADDLRRNGHDVKGFTACWCGKTHLRTTF